MSEALNLSKANPIVSIEDDEGARNAFQPRTGEKLTVITRQIIDDWRKTARTAPQPAPQPAPNPAPSGRTDTSPNTSITLDVAAQRFLQNHFRISNSDPSDVLDYIQRTYAAEVSYFGQKYTRQQVWDEQRRYMLRWPQRSFKLNPARSRIVCDVQRSFCDLYSELYFSVGNPVTLKTSAGVTTNEMRVVFNGGVPTVISENGTVISREPPPQAIQPSQLQYNQEETTPQQRQTQQIMKEFFGTVLRHMTR